MIRPPRYEGRGLVNLVAEIEQRLTGTSPSPGTDADLSGLIPDADTYILVLFDGLGDHQLAHRGAAPLRAYRAASLDAPFPTTTAVSLATVATGLAPRGHGIIGYHMWFEGVSSPVNVLKWTTPWGEPVPFPVESVLPAPNLWERLRLSGREPVTVQPGGFAGSPLSRMLYRGCRFEQAWGHSEIAQATIDLATRPGRLVFTYLPYVDVAAHMEGQASSAYEEALTSASSIWSEIASRRPSGTVLLGTADHGHLDYPQGAVRRVPNLSGVAYSGDPRALYARGPSESIAELRSLPARWVETDQLWSWWGPGDQHPSLPERAPDVCLLADRGAALLPPTMDVRWVGFHGGLEPAEVEVPLLVA